MTKVIKDILILKMIKNKENNPGYNNTLVNINLFLFF